MYSGLDGCAVRRKEGCVLMWDCCSIAYVLHPLHQTDLCTTSAAVLIAICSSTPCSGAVWSQDCWCWPPAAVLHPLHCGCRCETCVLCSSSRLKMGSQCSLCPLCFPNPGNGREGGLSALCPSAWGHGTPLLQGGEHLKLQKK